MKQNEPASPNEKATNTRQVLVQHHQSRHLPVFLAVTIQAILIDMISHQRTHRSSVNITLTCAGVRNNNM